MICKAGKKARRGNQIGNDKIDSHGFEKERRKRYRKADWGGWSGRRRGKMREKQRRRRGKHRKRWVSLLLGFTLLLRRRPSGPAMCARRLLYDDLFFASTWPPLSGQSEIVLCRPAVLCFALLRFAICISSSVWFGGPGVIVAIPHPAPIAHPRCNVIRGQHCPSKADKPYLLVSSKQSYPLGSESLSGPGPHPDPRTS